MDRAKLIESITTNAKKPGIWAKVLTVITALALVASLYSDIRDDIKSIGSETENIEETGELSEGKLVQAIVEIRNTIQFMFETIVKLDSRIDELENDNRELREQVADFQTTWIELLAGGSGTSGAGPNPYMAPDPSDLYEEPYVDASSGKIRWSDVEQSWNQ